MREPTVKSDGAILASYEARVVFEDAASVVVGVHAAILAVRSFSGEIRIGALVFFRIERALLTHAVDVGTEIFGVVGEAERTPLAFGHFGLGCGVARAPRKGAAIGAAGDTALAADVRRELSGAAIGGHVHEQCRSTSAAVVVRAFALAPDSGDGFALVEILDEDDGEHADLCVLARYVEVAEIGVLDLPVLMAV